MSLALLTLNLVFLIIYTADIAVTVYQWRAALHGIRPADSKIALPKHDRKKHEERIEIARKAYKSKYLDVITASAAVAVLSIAIWLAYEKIYKHGKSIALKDYDATATCFLAVSLNAVSNVMSSVFEFWLANDELNLATQGKPYPTRKTSFLSYRSFYIACAALLLIIWSFGLLDSSLLTSGVSILVPLSTSSNESQTEKHDDISSPSIKAESESRESSFKLKLKILIVLYGFFIACVYLSVFFSSRTCSSNDKAVYEVSTLTGQHSEATDMSRILDVALQWATSKPFKNAVGTVFFASMVFGIAFGPIGPALIHYIGESWAFRVAGLCGSASVGLSISDATHLWRWYNDCSG
ncbi:hypothetical protein G9P44_000047 [Scheffersomyces stipitis]|nr:hypothetical protein G9P44_000047 [Scheffersomyces stipitis]